MKVRRGFVSNSSSSSFVIDKHYLTPEQIDKIINHDKVGKELGMDSADTDYWDIDENKNIISGSTIMDNFDMNEFLDKIRVPRDKVRWDGDCGGFDGDYYENGAQNFIDLLKKDIEVCKEASKNNEEPYMTDIHFTMEELDDIVSKIGLLKTLYSQLDT